MRVSLIRENFKHLGKNHELDVEYPSLNFMFSRKLYIVFLFDLRASPSFSLGYVFHKITYMPTHLPLSASEL